MRLFRAFTVVVSTLFVLQLSAVADCSKALEISRNNFLSLQFEISGGLSNIRSNIDIEDVQADATATLHWINTVNKRGLARAGKVAPDEMAELWKLLSAARLDVMNGSKWEEKNLRDGFGEVLTLTLKDERKFVVENYGDKAPPEYFAITSYLQALKDKKFKADETK